MEGKKCFPRDQSGGLYYDRRYLRLEWKNKENRIQQKRNVCSVPFHSFCNPSVSLAYSVCGRNKYLHLFSLCPSFHPSDGCTQSKIKIYQSTGASLDGWKKVHDAMPTLRYPTLPYPTLSTNNAHSNDLNFLFLLILS